MRLIDLLAVLIGIGSWLVGAVLAKGFWSTTFAVVLPPYAWYLAVEKLLMLNGWL